MYPAGKMVSVRKGCIEVLLYRNMNIQWEIHISQLVVSGLHRKYCSRIARIVLQCKRESALVIAKDRYFSGVHLV